MAASLVRYRGQWDEVAAGLSASGWTFRGRVDTNRVALIGHSLGGLAAVELCQRSAAFAACADIDGQSAGGPFDTSQSRSAPDPPFLYLTKVTALPPGNRPTIRGRGSRHLPRGPAASHDQFADGALFRPGLNPFERTADRVAEMTRGFVAAGLQLTLPLEP